MVVAMNPTLGDYIHNALDRVEHTSTVATFYHQFTTIQGLLVQLQPWLPEEYLATRFIYGLQPAYQLFVLRFHPITVLGAYRLAEIYEESIDRHDIGEEGICGFECPYVDSTFPLIAELGNFLHDNMDQVTQTTSVEAFYHRFATIKSFLAAVRPWLPESYFADRFVYGLQAEYQRFVFNFHPRTVKAAYKLASIYEESIYLTYFPDSVTCNENSSSENMMIENQVEETTQRLPSAHSVCEESMVEDDFPELAIAIDDTCADTEKDNAILYHNQDISEAMEGEGEETIVTSPGPKLPYNSALAWDVIKDPKVHPPDMYPTSVNFSLRLTISVRWHNTGDLHQLNQSEHLPDIQAVQVSPSMQLRVKQMDSSYFKLLVVRVGTDTMTAVPTGVFTLFKVAARSDCYTVRSGEVIATNFIGVGHFSFPWEPGPLVSVTQDTVVYPMRHLVLSSHQAFNIWECPFTPGSTPHRGRMAELFILCFDPGILCTLHTRAIPAKHLLWSWSHVYTCLYLCEKVLHARILTYLMHAQGELVWFRDAIGSVLTSSVISHGKMVEGTCFPTLHDVETTVYFLAYTSKMRRHMDISIQHLSLVDILQGSSSSSLFYSPSLTCIAFPVLRREAKLYDSGSMYMLWKLLSSWYPVVHHHQGGRLCISMMSVLYWLTLKNAAPKVWEGSHNGTPHQFLYALIGIFEFDPGILLSSYPIMQHSMGRLLLLHHPLLVTTWILGVFCWLIAWSTKGMFQGAKRKAVELCACDHVPEFHTLGFIVKSVNAATSAEKCAIVLKALKVSILYPFLKQLSAGFSSWSWQQLLSNAIFGSSFERARVCHLSVCQSIAIFTLLCQSGSLIFHTTIESGSSWVTKVLQLWHSLFTQRDTIRFSVMSSLCHDLITKYCSSSCSYCLHFMGIVIIAFPDIICFDPGITPMADRVLLPATKQLLHSSQVALTCRVISSKHCFIEDAQSFSRPLLMHFRFTFIIAQGSVLKFTAAEGFVRFFNGVQAYMVLRWMENNAPNNSCPLQCSIQGTMCIITVTPQLRLQHSPLSDIVASHKLWYGTVLLVREGTLVALLWHISWHEESGRIQLKQTAMGACLTILLLLIISWSFASWCERYGTLVHFMWRIAWTLIHIFSGFVYASLLVDP